MPSWDWRLFFSTFALIFLAELPDKTAFAMLIMAAQGQALANFAGVALAFLVQTVVAVFFGRIFALLPAHWVHWASGCLFLAFAAWAWIKRNEGEDDAGGESEGQSESMSPSTQAPITGRNSRSFLRTALSAFLVIFIAEWGDLTQIATATLVARYEHSIFTIFSASVLALWCASAVAIGIGAQLAHRISPRRLKSISAVAFAIVGTIILIRA